MKGLLMWIGLGLVCFGMILLVTIIIIFGALWTFTSLTMPKCARYEYMQPLANNGSGVKLDIKEGDPIPEGARKVCAEWK